MNFVVPCSQEAAPVRKNRKSTEKLDYDKLHLQQPNLTLRNISNKTSSLYQMHEIKLKIKTTLHALSKKFITIKN